MFIFLSSSPKTRDFALISIVFSIFSILYPPPSLKDLIGVLLYGTRNVAIHFSDFEINGFPIIFTKQPLPTPHLGVLGVYINDIRIMIIDISDAENYLINTGVFYYFHILPLPTLTNKV